MLEIEHPLTGQRMQVANKDFAYEMNWYEALEACEKLGSGWRLPSIEELHVMCEVLEKKGNFNDSWYWSSSEFDTSDAFIKYLNSGAQSVDDKSNTGYVRAVRAF